jgi:hypothetical protein
MFEVKVVRNITIEPAIFLISFAGTLDDVRSQDARLCLCSHLRDPWPVFNFTLRGKP